MKEEPDSARSWAIAAAGFVINLLLSGVSRSTALFYVDLIQSYGISRMKANMPFTLRSIIRNLAGPLVGAIGHRFSTRAVTMTGGLFAFVGVASCSFVSDIVWISLFWGGIYGIGVALGSTLYPITVNQYFERFRATATGFAFSGSCVGSFAFPIIFEYLLTDIGLSGTFLLTGGLMLHVVPASMLMKEPPWIKKKSTITFNKNVNYASLGSNKGFSGKLNKREDSIEKTEEVFAIAYKRIPSTHDIFSKRHQNEIRSGKDIKDGVHNHGFQETFNAEIPINKLKMDDEALPLPGKIFSFYHDAMRMICDPMFHIISLSLAAGIVIFDICITIIVDFLKDKGISESDGKYFITAISVGDFTGRLGFGWVTDRKYLSFFKYMMILQIIQGALGMMAFLRSFNSLMVLVAVCSMASGASIVMYPILVAKYLPSVQSLALGSTSFAGGIIGFGVPPMIGYFRDTVGSYDSLYLVIGSFSVMTGLLWCFEPVFMKWKTGSKNKDIITAEMSVQIQKI